ncbi:MAG: hypothetical protein ACLSAH_16455 [Bilophila wadsworthia]
MRHTPLSWTRHHHRRRPAVDTARRRVVAARGEHNAQSPYGADVISRIRHETEWEEHRNGPNPLQQAIAKQVLMSLGC